MQARRFQLNRVLRKLDDSKEWFVQTPAFTLLNDSLVRKVWKDKVANLNKNIEGMFSKDM